MPVTAQQSHTELRFTLSAEPAARLRAWAESIRAMVFREQLATWTATPKRPFPNGGELLARYSGS